MARLYPQLGFAKLKNGELCSLLYIDNKIACITYEDPSDKHFINHTFVKINTGDNNLNSLISDIDENRSKSCGEELLDTLVDKSSINMIPKLEDLPKCKTIDKLIEQYLFTVDVGFSRADITFAILMRIGHTLGFRKKVEYRF